MDALPTQLYISVVARKRLKLENMPKHEYVREWDAMLAANLPNYEIIDEDEPSRIVLFKRKDSKYENGVFQNKPKPS